MVLVVMWFVIFVDVRLVVIVVVVFIDFNIGGIGYCFRVVWLFILVKICYEVGLD